MTNEESQRKHDYLKLKLIELSPRFPQMDDFEKFDDIPLDLRTPEALFVWQCADIDRFVEIPHALVDDDMRFSAVYAEPATIEHIFKEDADSYQKIAEFLVMYSASSLENIDPSLYTEQFISDAIISNPEITYYLPTIIEKGYKLTVGVVATAFEHSPEYLDALMCDAGMKKMVTDDMVQSAVKNSFVDTFGWWVDVKAIESLGKGYVVQQIISSGFWPPTKRVESDVPYFPDLERPKDLDHAILAFESEGYENFRALFKYAVRHYGPDAVISRLQMSSKGLDTLQNLYTNKELAPYIKKYRGLKGRFLEDSLGL